jgi:hypothetical protein
VVAAASYEARAFGVHSAMLSITAKRKCPDLMFVKRRFDAYKAISLPDPGDFRPYTQIIELLSLDEGYLDVTENLKGISLAIPIAEESVHLARQLGARSNGPIPTAEQFVADSALEEGGFEPLVPPQLQHNRGTGPISPTARIRVGLVIPLANSISISVASGTSGSNPLSSSRQSVSAVNAETVWEKPRTLAAFCGWRGT